MPCHHTVLRYLPTIVVHFLVVSLQLHIRRTVGTGGYVEVAKEKGLNPISLLALAYVIESPRRSSLTLVFPTRRSSLQVIIAGRSHDVTNTLNY
jgi:hypothetical protein